jgi:hypothetical protein
MDRARFHALLAVVAAGAIVIACDKDDPVVPATPQPTLDNVWPSDDGRSWTYRMTARWWWDDFFAWPPESALYDSAGLVPLVTLDDAESLLAANPQPDSVLDVTVATYRLVFDGVGTTQSGASGQRLRSEVTAGPSTHTHRKSAGRGVFWDRLMRARPDLQLNSTALTGERDILAMRGDEPLLLSPVEAWVKNSHLIAHYGDVDTTLSWWYLTANLSPESEFSLQLVPSLADDVFLHMRVLRKFNASTEAGSFANAIECLYLIDYGVSEGVLSDPGGFFRVFDYGTVIYAPTAGPIGSYERSFVLVGIPNAGVSDVQLDLLQTGGGAQPLDAVTSE